MSVSARVGVVLIIDRRSNVPEICWKGGYATRDHAALAHRKTALRRITSKYSQHSPYHHLLKAGSHQSLGHFRGRSNKYCRDIPTQLLDRLAHCCDQRNHIAASSRCVVPLLRIQLGFNKEFFILFPRLNQTVIPWRYYSQEKHCFRPRFSTLRVCAYS